MINHWDAKLHIDLNDMKKIHPCLAIVFYEFVLYCTTHGLPCKVSSITDNAPGRKSNTHATGRAIDISGRAHWKDDSFHRNRIIFHLNKKYGKAWGTSKDGKDPKVIIWHDAGTGPHFHMQCKRSLTWDHLIS